MIGLEVDGRPLLRAYSMASAITRKRWNSSRSGRGRTADLEAAEDQGGRHHPGRAQATGTLISDNLIPETPAAVSTGTGLAPFASLIKDPDVYDRFETIVLVHAAGRSPSSPMARSWWRNCGMTNCSGRC